jgi:hypothetical protein
LPFALQKLASQAGFFGGIVAGRLSSLGYIPDGVFLLHCNRWID